MKLSIVYVNWNTTTFLLDSLRSLKNLPAELTYEVIVEENASDHFDEAVVREVCPQAKIVYSDTNLGFGKGNNLGAKEAQGDYIWLLNTDAMVPVDSHMEKLVRFLDEHPEYGAASPLLKNAEGEVQPAQVAYFPSPAKTLLNIPVRGAAKLLPWFRGLYGSVNLDHWPVATRDVEVAVAAALVVRRKAYEEVGGFSSEFFMFFEDSDLCRKLHEAGYKVRWCTEATMVHLWGQSVRGNKAFVRRKMMYFESQDVYMRKWHSWAAHLVVRVLRAPLVWRYRLLNR